MAAYDRVRQSFADQFEPNGQGFLYRKYMKSAPIRVSAAERDRYIAAFNRYIRYASWGTGGGTVLLAFSLIGYAAAAGVDLPEAAFYWGIGAILVASMVGYYWYWNLPARELRDRGAVGETRSRAEVSRLLLEKNDLRSNRSRCERRNRVASKIPSERRHAFWLESFLGWLRGLTSCFECRSSASKVAH